MTPQLRNIKDGPFEWANKAMKRVIREKVADMKNGASILATYGALCELASDRQSEVFDAQHKEIADRALISISTVKRALPVLEELKAARITANDRPGSKLKAPSTYALLSPIAHNGLSIAHGKNTGHVSENRRIREESQKNDDNKALGNSLAREPRNGSQSSSSVFDESTKKRKRFANYCRNEGGTPMEEGFITWNKGPEIESDLPDTLQGCIDAMNALREVEKRAKRLSDGGNGIMTGPARAQYLRLKKHSKQFRQTHNAR